MALAAAYPDADGQYTSISLVPMREALNFAWDILQGAFLIMLVGVALVLIIACVNVASLTLARLGTRVREVALRQAMGAGIGLGLLVICALVPSSSRACLLFA